MRISEIAYKKISATALFISDIAAREVECMGYLLAKKALQQLQTSFSLNRKALKQGAAPPTSLTQDFMKKGQI